MNNFVRFLCPNCRGRLRVSANLVGTMVGCPDCTTPVLVPDMPPSLPLAERDEPLPLQPVYQPAPAPPPSVRKSAFESLDDSIPIRSRSRRSGTGSGAIIAIFLIIVPVVGALGLYLFMEHRAGGGGDQSNMNSVVAKAVLISLGILLYFAPTIIGMLRKHPNLASIVVVNFFLGWSLIGYVVSLAWAFSAQQTQEHIHRHYH